MPKQVYLNEEQALRISIEALELKRKTSWGIHEAEAIDLEIKRLNQRIKQLRERRRPRRRQ